MTSWPAKDPDATLDYVYRIPLDDLDRVTSHTLSVLSGTVAIESDDIAAAPDTTTEGYGQDVTAFLSGGAAGETSVFKIAWETLGGRENDDTIILPVKAVAEPLTLAQAKAQVNVTDDAWDDYLTSLIPASRRYVENRSGIIITQRQFTEMQYPARGLLTLNRRYIGAGPIRLTKRPIVSIDSVSYKDSDGADAAYTGARFFPGSSEIFPALGELWPSPYSGEGFTITYTAGLSAADLATDDYANLLHAMKLLIGHWFTNREAVVMDRAQALTVPLAVDDLCDQVRPLFI